MSAIRLQSRKHLLGYSWEILTPVLYAVCFLVVKRGLSDQSSGADHLVDVLRAFMGITLLQFWFRLLQDMSGLIRTRRSLLRGLNVSEQPLVLAVLFEALFGLCLRVVTVLAAMLFLGLLFPPDGVSWLWVLLSLLSVALSAAALGLSLAPWAALYPDVNKAIGSFNLPLVLLSPVFYPATQNADSLLYWVNCINPAAPVLATLMDAIAGRPPTYQVALVVWTLVAVVLLVLSARQLKAQVPIVLERLGA
ncbi:ABC transporter permease [Methyloversatilis sp. XJ19-49]|uniref:ABC transporter permease n=1 Tax=Methyloversatilis sp. XJ19-49 TaxID=2963429 RepID=UPI00211CD8F6|nr:ABC transporter permease [Methyloversatilis sp. XJ19-49]MCQ9378574.1 ABC transporter permease [Methyloversatilis sp. XJ19-49]